MFCLVFDNEDAFAKGLKLVIEKKPEEMSKQSDLHFSVEIDMQALNAWRDVSLVKIAALRRLNFALEALGSINDEFNLSAVNCVYKYGLWQPLRNLLKIHRQMNWNAVKLGNFITFLMRAQKFDIDEEKGNVDFSKFVDLLFEYAEYKINEQNQDQYSALHLALLYDKPNAIFELLKRGAYIGAQDQSHRPAICNIHPKILEKVMTSLSSILRI